MDKFCRNCGAKLSNMAKFCAECGEKILSNVDTQNNINQNPAQTQQAPTIHNQQTQNVYGNYTHPKNKTQDFINKKNQQRNTPNQAYTQPPQTPQPMPFYPVNNNFMQQQNQAKKKPSISTWLAIFLVIVLVVEGTVAGVWYPGFFTGGKSDPFNGYNDTDGPSEDTLPSAVDLTSYWMPPNPEEINLSYTEQEILNAPKTEMKVSQIQPSAASGDFSVDFGEFNKIDDDTFVVRDLPVHSDEKAGYSVKGYDFSLSSGRDTFYSEVKVTIPRDENDGDIVLFMTKNPETGENEEEYFEISEDGKNYILYTTHFSEHNMISFSDFGKGFVSDVKSGNVESLYTRNALSAFYYPTYVSWDKRMTAPVNYSPYDLWSKIADKYAYLPSSYSLMGAIDKKIKETPKGEIPDNVNLGGILLFDAKELEEFIGDANDAVDMVGNSKTLVIDPGVQALDKLSLEKISTGLKNAIHEHSEVVKNDASSNLFDCLGAITTIVGFELTNRKAIKELEQGKYETQEAAFWGNWEGYAGTGIGLVGLVGAAIGSTPVGVITAGAGVGLYFYSKSCETPYDDLEGVELNYREYYANKSGVRRFYYDDPDYAGDYYGEGVTGNIKAISILSKEQNETLKNAINNGMAKINGIGGITAEDTRDGLVNLDWSVAVGLIFRVLEKEPEKIGDAVQEFYKNYAEACWDLGDQSFLSFSKEAMKARGEDPKAARLPIDSNLSKKALTDKLIKELFSEHKDLFFDIAKQMEHQAQLEVDSIIRNELVPLLNTQMEFEVIDNTLDDPKNFARSSYNIPLRETENFALYQTETGSYSDLRVIYDSPMYFCIKNENDKYEHVDMPVFMPSVNFSTDTQQIGNTVAGLHLLKGEYKDYYPAKNNFLPMMTDRKGNVVFRCTYYHYLMMGAPTAMSFRNLNDEKSKEKEVDFEIPPVSDDGKIHVEIEAPDNLDKEVYKLRITDDASMQYVDNLFTNMDPLPAENTIEILANGKIKIDLPAVYKEYTHTYSNVTENFTFKRSAITLTGEINEITRSGYEKYGPLTSVPAVSGSITEVESITETYTGLINVYKASTVITMNNPILGTISDTGYYDLLKKESMFELHYDKQTGKLKSVGVDLYGNWFQDYQAAGYADGEGDVHLERISIILVVED